MTDEMEHRPTTSQVNPRDHYSAKHLIPPPQHHTHPSKTRLHTPRGRDSPTSSDTMVSKILFWSGFGTRAQTPSNNLSTLPHMTY
jgi:hypothetical protein